MARGYPDFFGFSIFPFFGVPQEQYSGPVVIPAGTEATLIDVSGKGKTYGGELWFDGDADARDLAQPIIELDGLTFSTALAATHLFEGWNQDPNRLLRLVSYWLSASATSGASFDIGKDYTFGYSLVVKVNHLAGANLNAYCRVRWAKVI